jgi:hypothetical protein
LQLLRPVRRVAELGSLGHMEKRIPSWVFWGLIGLLVFINLILLSAFVWQYRQNQRLREQLVSLEFNNTETTTMENAYVKLYSDQNYKGEVLTIVPLQAPQTKMGLHGDLKFLAAVQPDNATSKDFNDKASSAIYLLPKGCTVVLFQDANFKNEQLQLIGTGKLEKIPDFRNTDPPFNDFATSLRWIQE